MHEMAVAWIRRREAITQRVQPWLESIEQFQSRMRDICEHINAYFDVDGLCRAFPKRLEKVIESEGDRVKW